MSLFNCGYFVLHSGTDSDFKIDCDSLKDEDIDSLAAMVGPKLNFGSVEGVPEGGLRLAKALKPYATSYPFPLIVDDVLTTGKSMEEQRAGRHASGLVIFSRTFPCPQWIKPLFTQHTWWHQ